LSSRNSYITWPTRTWFTRTWFARTWTYRKQAFREPLSSALIQIFLSTPHRFFIAFQTVRNLTHISKRIHLPSKRKIVFCPLKNKRITFFQVTRNCSAICFTDLDQGSKIIIFVSILTTFKANIISEVTSAVAKVGLSSKSNHHKQI
jgi:hypothetical protein